ncbi:helix-turn-helix domain-containing protein [Endozoicomonas atrinae]|uniref:helix-turn-helix domain-containing protein n=1 Tax=Endozoicomonas atrinae TaxID=1333660 RepID=UPI000824EA3E|nr:helix-turn-helix transcriptional regulator [Endozoicomonas atrinae]
MNHPEIAERFKKAMDFSGITSIPKLARRTGIDRGYLYKLANGEIANPHKYLDRLSESMGICPVWLSTGRGGPYDHERPSLRRGVFKTLVTVIPGEGDPFEIDITVPDLFNSLRHVPKQPEFYQFFYIVETNDHFPGNTLLTVEKVRRPGPGLYVAWYPKDGVKQLGCFNYYYEELELKHNRREEMDVIGRVRNMDYWKVDEIMETGSVL